MSNYYNLDFEKIYKNATVKNNTADVKKVLDLLPVDVDFNNVDDLVEKIWSKNRSWKPTYVAGKLKHLAAFIQILDEEELSKLKITDKKFLVNSGKNVKEEEKGTYYIKRAILEKPYNDSRINAVDKDIAAEALPSIEEYNTFYEKNLEKATSYLEKAVFTPEEAMSFMRCFLVCMKHDLPDMRGGATYCEMLIDNQLKQYNYVIHSKVAEMVIIVYNRYKTSDKHGIITEIINKGDTLYALFEKAIYIANLYKVSYLFHDYEKQRPFIDKTFNLFIAEAHDELKISQAQISIIDESIELDGVNPVGDLGNVTKNRKKGVIT